MGLFSKLFSKKEKEPEKERITIDTAYGKFYYQASPAVNEYGYESNIGWYPKDCKNRETTVFIETDSPETTEAGKCVARFERLFADKEAQDEKIRSLAVRYFLSKPDLLSENSTEEDIMNDSWIFWIGVLRNGDTQFSLDFSSVYADDICITLKADGSREISYNNDDPYDLKKFHDKL